MSRWILTVALAGLLACNPNTGPNFGGNGSNTDDTGAEDTGESPTSDCPPTWGEIAATVDDYPGKGWVVEVLAPFTEGSCSIDTAEMYVEHEDEGGDMTTEGPYSVGFEDEDVYVEDYDADAGTGSLFYAFPIDSASDQMIFTMWVEFSDGSESAHAEVTVGG